MDAVEMYEEIEMLQEEPNLTKEQQQRMKELQAKLQYRKLSGRKLSQILSKGQDMKQSEVMLLLESGITKDTICKALDMNLYEFNKYLRNIGLQLRRRG